MTVDYKQLIQGIEFIESKLTTRAKNMVIVDLNTPIRQELVIERNKVITGLKAAFFTSTGHVNIPALLMFCHSNGLTYSTMPFGNVSAFSVTYGMLTLNVSYT